MGTQSPIEFVSFKRTIYPGSSVLDAQMARPGRIQSYSYWNHFLQKVQSKKGKHLPQTIGPVWEDVGGMFPRPQWAFEQWAMQISEKDLPQGKCGHPKMDPLAMRRRNQGSHQCGLLKGERPLALEPGGLSSQLESGFQIKVSDNLISQGQFPHQEFDAGHTKGIFLTCELLTQASEWSSFLILWEDAPIECKTTPEKHCSCDVHLILFCVDPTFQLTACAHAFFLLECHLLALQPAQNWLQLLLLFWRLSMITTIYRDSKGQRENWLWLLSECSSNKHALVTACLTKHLPGTRHCAKLSIDVITLCPHNNPVREITYNFCIDASL